MDFRTTRDYQTFGFYKAQSCCLSDLSGCGAADYQGKAGAQRYSDAIKHLWTPVSVTAKKGS